MNDIHLRDAGVQDRDAIRTVTLSEYEQYSAPLGRLWQVYRDNIIATLADVAPAEQIVAETRDGIVGTVLLYPAGSGIQLPDGASVTLSLPEVRLLAVAP